MRQACGIVHSVLTAYFILTLSDATNLRVIGLLLTKYTKLYIYHSYLSFIDAFHL